MPWPPTRAFAALAALCSLALIGAAPEPRARALLIGVGDYPGLPADLHLAAPANDVQRMRAVLIGSGFDPRAIEVMSEREGERPTRAAVLAALKRLADDPRPSSQVLVYFSGHGAQAPARHPEREPDGLEELFLTADASGWDGATGTVKGAIADFEMEAALAAIEAHGSSVWFVADACHAGGLTRGALPAGTRAKTVGMAALHIPRTGSALRGAEQDPAPLSAAGFAGFYAAGPGSLALERPLPAGEPDAKPASVFTYSLARAIAQGRTRSLRDLALAVLGGELERGPGAAVPVFDGALSQPVLELPAGPRIFKVRRTPEGLQVQAGAAEGFDTGARVDLVGDFYRKTGEAVVARGGVETGLLRTPGSPPDGPLFARLQSPPAEGDRGRRLLAALEPHLGETPGLELDARRLAQGCRPNPPARQGFPANSTSFRLMAAAPLHHCDVLYVRIVNRSPQPLDVSPLYVDADGGVAALTLTPEDEVRMQPGDTRFLALRVLTRDGRGRALPHGVERLVLVAAPANSTRFDLRSLAGPAVMRGAEPGPDPDRPGLMAQVFPLRVED